MILGFLLFPVLVQSAIMYRSGKVTITAPDGSIMKVEESDTLPRIASGSIVELLEGAVDITSTEGFIQVVAADSVATVLEGERLIASIKEGVAGASFKVVNEKVTVISGNSTTYLKKGEVVRINFNNKTGVVELSSISGIVEVVTVGVKAVIPQDAVAKIKVNAKTRKVEIVSLRGEIQVVALDGEVIRLAKAVSLKFTSSDSGTIQTFDEEPEAAGFVPDDEPPEPEIPETSPHTR